MKQNVGVILSGGSGKRAGTTIPKQYCKVKDKMVIEYVIDAFKKSKLIDAIIIAADQTYYEYIEKYDCILVEGGKERKDTINNVLEYVKSSSIECEKIIFHDSARPLIKSEYLDECIQLLDEYESVITTSKITDSLGCISGENVARENYFLIQTPEAFVFQTLYNNFDVKQEYTAIVQYLKDKSRVYNNYNLTDNMKITYSSDFRHFEYKLEEYR